MNIPDLFEAALENELVVAFLTLVGVYAFAFAGIGQTARRFENLENVDLDKLAADPRVQAGTLSALVVLGAGLPVLISTGSVSWLDLSPLQESGWRLSIWVGPCVLAISLLFLLRSGETSGHWWLGDSMARFTIASVLGGNGVGLLIQSKRLDAVMGQEWWSGLWLELGAALIFAAIVDLIFELNRTIDPAGRADVVVQELRTGGDGRTTCPVDVDE